MSLKLQQGEEKRVLVPAAGTSSNVCAADSVLAQLCVGLHCVSFLWFCAPGGAAESDHSKHE